MFLKILSRKIRNYYDVDLIDKIDSFVVILTPVTDNIHAGNWSGYSNIYLFDYAVVLLFDYVIVNCWPYFFYPYYWLL